MNSAIDTRRPGQAAAVAVATHVGLLAAIVEAADDAIVSQTPDGVITSWNQAAQAIYGYSADEVVGKSISILIRPDQVGEMDVLLSELRSGKHIDHYETLRVRKDGRAISVSLTLSPILDERGRVAGVSSIARDITVRVRAEEKLLEASLYARSLIEVSLDPLVTISVTGKITDVNEATIKITGVAREDLIGTDFSDYFTEPENARQAYRQVFEKGSFSDYPLTIRGQNGKLADVLYNASVYKDALGNVLGVFAAARDVTAQKQSQSARSLIEASLDPLVTISTAGKITDVNEATIKVTGVSREGLIGTDFSDYFTEPDKARVGYERVFAQGFVTDYPLTIRHRSGRLTNVLYNASVYKDVLGNVLGVAAARDVTKQKRAEEEVADQRAQDLERLGELERFQKLTIGRELRMIELKKENEALRGERDRLAAPALV
ncbi:MAG: hypothetical protein QOF71_1179 [Candidatus Eremiobacteraeota bacterium]|jgi:PAS domain S-box-containing protein|nr:hypothetical protein [Candidatus Eremiobacteraeota bacterium]